jgi:hypothetical protein
MTLRYAHLSPAHLRGAVARLEGLTGRPAGGPTPADAATVTTTATTVEAGPAPKSLGT